MYRWFNLLHRWFYIFFLNLFKDVLIKYLIPITMFLWNPNSTESNAMNIMTDHRQRRFLFPNHFGSAVKQSSISSKPSFFNPSIAIKCKKSIKLMIKCNILTMLQPWNACNILTIWWSLLCSHFSCIQPPTPQVFGRWMISNFSVLATCSYEPFEYL